MGSPRFLVVGAFGVSDVRSHVLPHVLQPGIGVVEVVERNGVLDAVTVALVQGVQLDVGGLVDLRQFDARDVGVDPPVDGHGPTVLGGADVVLAVDVLATEVVADTGDERNDQDENQHHGPPAAGTVLVFRFRCRGPGGRLCFVVATIVVEGLGGRVGVVRRIVLDRVHLGGGGARAQALRTCGGGGGGPGDAFH